MARWLPVIAGREPTKRAIATNGSIPVIAECFVRRAYCLLSKKNSTIKYVETANITDGSGLEGLRIEIARTVYKALGGNPDTLTQQQLRAELMKDRFTRNLQGRSAHNPIIVVVPIQSNTAAQIQELMNDPIFRFMTFFFLSEQPLDPEEQAEYRDVFFLRPNLAVDIVDQLDEAYGTGLAWRSNYD